jgi:hypothetical protein
MVTAITAAGYSQAPHRAVELFEEIPKYGLKLDGGCYMVTIYAIRKTPYWAKAIELFDQMKSAGFKVDVIAYTSLLAACQWGQSGESAARIFEDAVQNGVNLDQRIYDTLLWTLLGSKQIGHALYYLTRMLDDGVPPRKQVLRTLSSACPEAREVLRTISNAPDPFRYLDQLKQTLHMLNIRY